MIENKIFISLLPLIIANGIMIISIIIFAFIYPHRKRTPEVLEKMHPTFIGVFLREYFYWFISPLLRLATSLRLTPNMITGVSLLISFFSGYYYFEGNFALAGWILVVNGGFDVLDGQLARTTNQVTRQGAFFDSCSDRYAEGIVFMGIALYFRNSLFMLSASILALIGSMLVSYVKARGEAVGVTTKKGLMQRAERVFVIVIVSVLYPFSGIILSNYSINPEMPMIVAIVLLAVLTNYTAVVRMVVIFKELKKLNSQNE